CLPAGEDPDRVPARLEKWLQARVERPGQDAVVSASVREVQGLRAGAAERRCRRHHARLHELPALWGGPVLGLRPGAPAGCELGGLLARCPSAPGTTAPTTWRA